MSLQYWFQSTMECSLPICNSCWTSSTDTPLDFPALRHHRQVRPSNCHNCKCDFSKKLPRLMLNLFLQSLYLAASVNAINCTIQSLLSAVATASWANHLRSKQPILSTPSSPYCRAPILTSDILSKMA